MKCSLGICNFLEEISRLSDSIVFLYFFALFIKEGLLSLLAILWNSTFTWEYLSLSSFAFCFSSFLSYLYSLLRQPLHLLAFLFLWDGFGHCLLYNVGNLCP